MCEVLDRAVNKGIKQGIKQGIEQGIEKGIEQGIQKIIRNMLKLNKSIDEIAMCCGVSADDVKAIQKSIREEEF